MSTQFVCARCLLRQSRAKVAGSSSGGVRYSPTRIARYSTNPPWRASTSFSLRVVDGLSSNKSSRVPQRRNSTDSALSKNVAPAGAVKLSHRRLIHLSGHDASKFLQGLVSNNVDPKITAPYYAAFLDARGRMMLDAFIYPDTTGKTNDWACWIEVDSGEADILLKHLKKHKLRSKVQLRLVDNEELSVWAAWQDTATEEDNASSAVKVACDDDRAPGFGRRILLDGSSINARTASGSFSLPLVEIQAYHLRRFLFGIPEGPTEMPPANALPMESNIDLMGGIDFRKGCYVGQELTIRTKHTGVVRKRILPVQLYHATESSEKTQQAISYNPLWPLSKDDNTSERPIAFATDIKQLDEDGSVKKGRAAGKFLAGVGNVGLALCRLEMMTDMKVSAEGGSWRPGMEFGLKLGDEDASGNGAQEVRIKAIVPQWLRDREKQIWEKPRAR